MLTTLSDELAIIKLCVANGQGKQFTLGSLATLRRLSADVDIPVFHECQRMIDEIVKG